LLTELNLFNYDSFIGGWFLENENLCDRIIETFENNKHLSFEGCFGPESVINYKVKKDKELYLNIDENIYKEYSIELQKVCDEYIKKYYYSNNNSAWRIIDVIKIQKYEPHEGYYAWHCERGCKQGLMGSRHLTFLTYLNDVKDEGETEFFYQNIKVKPKKGLTLIWPTDWTHTHRGLTSRTENKYIVTGWYNYI
jgi:hypothetical protein